MKTLFTTITAGFLAISFAASANAVPSKASRAALAQHQTACKAQAAKKFSAIHFMKRRAFVNDCMGYTSHAKAKKVHHVKTVKMQNKKVEPTTTGQSVK
jgi:hypothetical protein